MAEPLPLWKPPSRGEIPEAPEWMERWMAPYNRQMKAITDTLSGGIDSKNEASEEKTVEVRHGVPLPVTCSKVKTKPKGLLILATEYPIASWAGRGTDTGKLELTVNFASPAPAGDVPVTIKILGGV